MARDLQGPEPSPLGANVLGEKMNRGGLLIRSPLDITSRPDPSIAYLRTGGTRLEGHARSPVDTRGKKSNRFFPF